MHIDLYAAVSSLAVRFAHFLIGEPKCVLLQRFFCPSLHVVFVYNTCYLMNQMTPKKENLKNLDLNPGQLVRLVLDWVVCCLA